MQMSLCTTRLHASFDSSSLSPVSSLLSVLLAVTCLHWQSFLRLSHLPTSLSLFPNSNGAMVSATARVSLRIAFALVVLLVAFYVGRPLYWKLSATIHEIREKKQTVREGLSQFVLDARRSVGWVHDESDPGIIDDSALVTKARAATNRQMLWFLDAKQDGRS